jgi:AraC family transcriptional activator of mtrCDE
VPEGGKAAPFKVLSGELPNSTDPGGIRKFVAGEEAPKITLICGYFRASYATMIDLFGTLLSPIVEEFDATDELGNKLKAVVAELAAQQVGMRAMTTALIKQIIVSLLRRSLSSDASKLDRFSLLKDLHVTRAFAEMVARPGAAHSLQTLSHTAGLSRSVFVARFASAFGCPPMVALRQLRMRHAANLLTGNVLSVEQVAHAAGYDSRSSFVRAFREAYGTDPSDYRASAWKPADGAPSKDAGLA